MNEKSNFDINFAAIFENLLKKIWIILLCAVIASGAAYVYVNFFVTPMYSSTATLYVGNKAGVTNVGDLNISGSLAKDFEEIIKKHVVLDEVADTLGLDMTAGQLRSCMSVKNISDTRILDITVSTPNPAMSKNIVDTICEVSSEKLVSIVQVEYVNIVDRGSLSTVPSNVNLVRSMIFAALVGAFLCALVIIIRTVMDDKIKTPDDIELYLGLSVLGTTPFSKSLDGEKSKGGKVLRRRTSKSVQGRS